MNLGILLLLESCQSLINVLDYMDFRPPKMHILQPKHTKLNAKDSEKLLADLNVAEAQLPKILLTDPALPEGCNIGDIIKIERKDKEKIVTYFRVVV